MIFSVATCNYCTPEITLTMLKSFRAHHPDLVYQDNIFVVDNSPYGDRRTCDLLKENNIKTVYRASGGRHETGIDIIINQSQTRYVLLVDSDTIFLRNCEDLVEMMGDAVILGNVSGDRGGKLVHDRVDPWFCLIDTCWIREHRLYFYDSRRFWTSGDRPDVKRYDVGSSFLEDIRGKGLGVKNVNLEGVYFKHYEGMSWHGESSDPILKASYERKRRAYDYEVRKFADVDMNMCDLNTA